MKDIKIYDGITNEEIRCVCQYDVYDSIYFQVPSFNFIEVTPGDLKGSLECYFSSVDEDIGIETKITKMEDVIKDGISIGSRFYTNIPGVLLEKASPILAILKFLIHNTSDDSKKNEVVYYYKKLTVKKMPKPTNYSPDATEYVTISNLIEKMSKNNAEAEELIKALGDKIDYTALQNLPRTLCSGTLELTEVTDGGYEASGVTSVTYNGTEKFRLDKGNLLFLKESDTLENGIVHKDKTVNIQTGYGCYCIDNISEKVNDDWTDYFGVTEKELQNELDTVKSALDNRQHSFDADNGLSFNRTKTTLSLTNGSTVLKKADMSTAITASGRYDIAESGDMLISFPGITNFTPFTLKVNKGDIVKILFDTDKNVTDVLYIGDISQNYDETTMNDAAGKGYWKNPFFDITVFELSVHTDGNCYQQAQIGDISDDDCISFGHNLYDLIYQNLNIPRGKHMLLASTTQKDEWKNPIYEFVRMSNGLMLVSSDKVGGYPSSKLTIVPAQLNLSESYITYNYESESNETLKDFAENVFSYIDDLQFKIDELKKAVGTGIENGDNLKYGTSTQPAETSGNEVATGE